MALLDKIRPAGGFSKATAGHVLFRFIQMVMALAVVGLYAQDLRRANRVGKYQDGKWVYATVVSSLAAVTALVYMVPLIVRIPFIFVWDTILFILWIALFGIFGALFIKENPEGNGGIKRMKNAVWVDLVNALLWLISAAAMGFYWFKHRGTRTQYTARATV